MQMGLSSEEIWDSLELKLINVKGIKNLDPMLVARIDAVINHYNGNITKGFKDSVLGKVEALVKILESKEYYKIRNIDGALMNKLVDLGTELDLFRKVIVNEINSAIPVDKKTVSREKLPNLATDKEEELYKDNGATPRII